MTVAIGMPGPCEMLFILAFGVAIVVVVVVLKRKSDPPRGFEVQQKKESK